MNIIADSNYFVALGFSDDISHSKSITISKKLKKNHDILYINEYIFLETITVLSQRVNKEVALRFGSVLLNNQDKFIMVNSNEYLFLKTWEVFSNMRNKNVSFADCSLIPIMERARSNHILTFDFTDFKKLQELYNFSFYE